jgi:ArsR family transcriptional regulator
MSMTEAELAGVFRALADENRLAVVRDLAGKGEMCACQLLDGLDISQPTLSHHMRVLCDCGLVRCRRKGRWCYYSVDSQVALDLVGFFQGLSMPDEGDAPAPRRCCEWGSSRPFRPPIA